MKFEGKNGVFMSLGETRQHGKRGIKADEKKMKSEEVSNMVSGKGRRRRGGGGGAERRGRSGGAEQNGARGEGNEKEEANQRVGTRKRGGRNKKENEKTTRRKKKEKKKTKRGSGM